MSDDITRVSLENLDDLDDRTDWDRLESLSDEEIEAAVEADPDQELLGPEWFKAATLVDPSADKQRITIRLDEDIVDYFKKQGSGYQSRINKVLRAYVLTRKLRDLMSEETQSRDLQPFLEMIATAMKTSDLAPAPSSSDNPSAMYRAMKELFSERSERQESQKEPVE
jgi:uncharacterized protein (DUF4415 family)